MRKGFPVSVISKTKKRFAVSDAELAKMAGVNIKSFRRNLMAGRRMSLVASDRIFRLIDILCLAMQVFASHKSAIWWMREPNFNLRGRKPIDLIETEAGGNKVRDILTAIIYGYPV
ncbi:DUF2384 domain-containing protein [Patescibacteria group bacterium]|nr:DUF2384 domain-containing protein [Patescibacteria group bacterium]